MVNFAICNGRTIGKKLHISVSKCTKTDIRRLSLKNFSWGDIPGPPQKGRRFAAGRKGTGRNGKVKGRMEEEGMKNEADG
jgi:hypothetical protein